MGDPSFMEALQKKRKQKHGNQTTNQEASNPMSWLMIRQLWQLLWTVPIPVFFSKVLYLVVHPTS